MAQNPYAKYVQPVGGGDLAPISAPAPSASKQAEERRKAASDEREAARFDLAVKDSERGERTEQRTVTKDRFEQEGKLRDDFNQNAEVKAYRAALPMLAQALRAPKNGQGDLSIIYAYAKLMDPTSVVRESEMDMVNSSSPWVEAKVQQLQNQLDSSGRLPDNARRNLEQEMIRTTAARRKSYKTQFDRYRKNAETYGLDPEMVIGPDEGQAFFQDFLAYDKERGLGGAAADKETAPLPGSGNAPTDGGDGTINPEMRGGLTKGTQVTFDGDGAGAPDWWDRNAWLMQTRGITPDQESNIIGFWNANRGNAGLTPEGVLAWYDRNGIPHPPVEEITSGIESAQKGLKFGAFDDTEARNARKAELEGVSRDLSREDGTADDKGNFDPNSMGAYRNRAGTGLSLNLYDEISGLEGGANALMQGRNPVEGYKDTRDAERLRYEQMSEAQGVPGTITEVVGSLPTAAIIPTGRGGVVGNVVRGSGMTADAVRGGIRAGAIAGYGSGTDLGSSVRNAGAGGIVGGVLGGVVGKGAEAITARAANAAPKATTADNMAMGRKFGVDLSLGDAGGAGSRVVERILDVQPGSATVMNASRVAKTDQIVNAVDDVAEAFGPTTNTRGIGEAAQAGAKNWIGRFEKASAKAYDAIPIKGDTPAVTANTVSRLNELTGKFSSNPKLAAQLKDKRLEGYLEALQDGGLSWQDLKALRSRIGEEIGQQMFGEGTLKSDLRGLYAALSDDMKQTAAQLGPKAQRAFERANTLYRDGQARIEGAVTKLLGKDGMQNPEKTASFIQSIAKGGKSNSDLAALREVRATLRPDEWGQVQNGLIRLLGQPANSEGRDFAAQTFVRNFADMSDDAKNVVFGNGPLRKNLDEFAEVIGLVAKSDGTRNVSNTAMGISGLIGFGAGGYTGLVMQAVTSYGAAKLWTSPIFVKWATGLAQAGKNGGGAAFKAQIDKLPKIIAANDNIAPEATELANRLASIANQSTAAATPEDQK